MPEQPNQSNSAENTTNQKSDNASVQIPQFMTTGPETDATENDSISRNAGNLYTLMLGISVVWLLIVIVYITQFFGWSNLFLMMPDEFGGFLAGITLPLAVVWMVIAYVDRGASFKQEAKFLRSYMNQLVYPEDGAAQTTKAMADAIRSQVIELQQVTKLATEETEKIKNELGQHVTDFSKLVTILQGYSGTTMNELNGGIKLMSQGLDYISEKVNTLADDVAKRINDFSGVADNVKIGMDTLNSQLDGKLVEIKSGMNDLSSQLESKLSEIKIATDELSNAYGGHEQIVTMNSEILNNCSASLNESFSSISNFVNFQSSHLEKISAEIINNYQNIYKQLNEKANIVEKTFTHQTDQILNYMKTLDSSSLMASGKFEEFRGNLNQEIDSIMSRAKTISDCVELKVQDLTGLADTINQSMDSVEQHVTDKIKSLQQTSETTVAEINKASSVFDDKIAALHQDRVNMVESAKAQCLAITEQGENLSTVTRNIQETLQGLCSQMSADIQQAQTSGRELISGMQEAEMLINRQTTGFKEISDTFGTQSKLNSSVMDQQQKLLSSALTKIENGKENLKAQMDDLLRMANAIDDEAISVVKRMNAELTTSLQKYEEMTTLTTQSSETLQNQTQSLSLTSDQLLAKISDFSSSIKSSHSALDSLVQNVASRAENVAAILDAQVKAVNVATDASSSRHNKLLELFNQQSSILNNTAENTVRYVSDMVQSLDEKAETINVLFKNQQSEFFEICDKLSENTGVINNTLKNQISLLEQSSDRIFGRMSGFEEEFSKKAELLTLTSNQTIDKLLNVNEILTQQNQAIDNSVQLVSNKIKTVSDDMDKIIGGLSGHLQNIKEESAAAGNEIAANCVKLKDCGRTLINDSRNVSQMLDDQFKHLDDNLTKIKNQSEHINTNFNKQKDSITDIVNLVSTQTRLGEASLAQQYKYLSDAANDVSVKMKEIENLFHNNTSGIFDTNDRLIFEINTLSDRVIKAGEIVQKSVKQSVRDIESVGISLGSISETLEGSITGAHEKVDNIINEYKNYIAGFNTVTAEASSGVVEVNNLISQQNDKMIKISEDTKHLVESFNIVLGEAAAQLSKRAGGAFEQIKSMGAQMKELSLQLENSTQLTAKHMDNAGEKMRANINEIAANAERISNDIRSSGEVFLKQSDVLVNATNETITKVNAAMDALKSGSDNLTDKGKMWLEQTGEFSKIFERQAEIIDTTSLKATENLCKLEAKYQEVQTDNFLKDAAVLFERMETIAIDINRIFNPGTEEEIWKKYYGGDTAAFVRYLSKVMTKNQIGAIRKEYEGNADFRSLVNRYVSDFEMLITKAKGNERAGVLLSVISGSDVGKVYYVIAKALDKLN